MRNRAEFNRAAKKRLDLRAAGRFSEPDVPGAKVAVLMPFVRQLVRQERDDFSTFEQDADALLAYLSAHDREPVLTLPATVADFEVVLADPTIPSVILRGFGSLSAVAVPMSADDDSPAVLLDWLHLSKMSQHLKRGTFVMRTCGGTPRLFNAPLPYGVMASHRSISAPVGNVISIVGLDDPANELIRPVTDSDELSYDDIKRQFPLQRLRPVPGYVPDVVYCGSRALHNFVSHDARVAFVKADKL
jgi:hypothetical protein